MTLPTRVYSSHVRRRVVERVAAGERLRDICAEAGMPCCESVSGWARREPEGFGAELAAAFGMGDWRRRRVVDEGQARAILAGLAEGRRLEDLVRGPGMPSLRVFMAWKREQAWIAEAYALVMAAREESRRGKARRRWRAFDPAVADRLYVRLVKGGEPLRRVLASQAEFPSLMVLARWRKESAEFDAQMRFVLGGWRRKRGRERGLWSPELADAITDEIVVGASLRGVAAMPGMPCARTLYAWVRTRPEFAARVARACVIREQWFADQIGEIELAAGTVREGRRRSGLLRKQMTRLRKRPGWKARKAGG